MKRKSISLFIAVILLSTALLPVYAASTHSMIIDDAGLMSASDVNILEKTALELRDQFEMDFVILTVDSLNGKSAQKYADDFYDANGYGYGDAGSGVLFLLSMEEREWYISTCGDAVYALTDYGIQQLGESILWHLSSGNYAAGFQAYLSLLPDYLNAYQTGHPIDGHADYSGDYYHGNREDVVYYKENRSPNLFFSLVIGVIAAAISIIMMRASLNTKQPQRTAVNYLTDGSYHLKTRQDIFLYSNVSKVRRQQNSGGGSSVHRSSGGRHHGGGGGRF